MVLPWGNILSETAQRKIVCLKLFTSLNYQSTTLHFVNGRYFVVNGCYFVQVPETTQKLEKL